MKLSCGKIRILPGHQMEKQDSKADGTAPSSSLCITWFLISFNLNIMYTVNFADFIVAWVKSVIRDVLFSYAFMVNMFGILPLLH